MVFARQLAVRFGDVILGGVLGDTEDFVEILAQPFILSHSGLLSCMRVCVSYVVFLLLRIGVRHRGGRHVCCDRSGDDGECDRVCGQRATVRSFVAWGSGRLGRCGDRRPCGAGGHCCPTSLQAARAEVYGRTTCPPAPRSLGAVTCVASPSRVHVLRECGIARLLR